MLHSPLLIPPSADFWSEAARGLMEEGMLSDAAGLQPGDFSAVRILVPGFAHASLLKAALALHLGRAFIPPRIGTLSAWLAMLPPDADEAPAASASERLMALYAELRQHGWLKKLFSARRNTDLLPLAQTLTALFDELSAALLPSLRGAPDAPDASDMLDAADERWQAALRQLPLPARNMLSDEAQLVWSLWKTQLGSGDAAAADFTRALRMAAAADGPLVWIGPEQPNALQQAFLLAYAERQPVLPVMLDWRPGAVDAVYAAAWSEALEAGELAAAAPVAAPPALSLQPASSLEDEAQRGAQTVLEWLQAGFLNIAIVAQDRAVARRIRALLERAQVFVADETGWQLSTTRAAATVMALFDVAATRAETATLLDLLKSPFVFAGLEDKADRVMAIERALRRFNVLGGWEAAQAALGSAAAERELLAQVARQAALFAGRKNLGEWSRATGAALEALDMRAALEEDAAGAQVIALLDLMQQDCDALPHPFSFAEWRAFLGMQLESTPFVPAVLDRRVVMLQLNGAPLRTFDAVLLVGADADHLPSQSNETLFFANAVRRELGLATRELRQRAQLRALIELLSANPRVVLSWQSHRDGEPNAVSGWIERLQLTLERAGAAGVAELRPAIARQTLRPDLPRPPQPSAPQLLPGKLSASGYNSLVACPYQFFATRMLGLAALDELSELPEKRDYGDWLHDILKIYHETLRDRHIDATDREALLRQISEDVFGQALARSAAALGYYARWQKAIPAYLQWAGEREAQGWWFVAGEEWVEKTVSWPGGRITLHGCIDRIDENGDGERAVLDYKTKNLQSLRERLKEGEDHQLAFYGVLSGSAVTAGHYVALEVSKEKTGDADAANFAGWQLLLEERIVASIGAIAQGAPLPATGIERVCGFCDVRGLCRKGAW